MPANRPFTVTLACLYAGAGGAIGLWDFSNVLLDWGSLGQQQAIHRYLGRSSGRATGVDVDTVLRIGRPIVSVLLVCCIASIVFAVYALRGHNPSRVALTLLGSAAVVGFGLSIPYGLLPAILAVLTVSLLWSRPARAFFAGEDPDRPVNLGAAPSVPPAARTMSQAPAPAQQPSPGPLPAVGPVLPPYRQARPAPDPGAMPRAVLTALLVVALSSLLALIGLGLILVTMLAGREQMLQTLRTDDLVSQLVRLSGMSVDQYYQMMVTVMAAAFALAAVGLASAGVAALWRRGGRVVLMVMSIVAVVASIFTLPLGVVTLAAAVYVLILLAKPEAKAWFR